MPSADVFRAGEILALTISVRVICIMIFKLWSHCRTYEEHGHDG